MKHPIQLTVSVLKAALAGLTKVLPRKSGLPVLHSLRIGRDETGAVFIQATDLDSFVTFRTVTSETGEPVTFLFPADLLVKAAKSLHSEDQVALIQEDPETVLLRYWVSGKAVDQKARVIPLADWPVEPEVKQTSILLDATFKETLHQALECVSTDESRYLLNGVCIDVSKPKAHYLVGTNGRILYCANSFHLPLTEPVILPARKFLSWSGFGEDGDWNLGVQPIAGKASAIRIQSPNWTLVTRAIEGNYPNWMQVQPEPSRFRSKIVLGEPAVEQLVDLIAKVSGNQEPNYPLGLKITGSELFILGREKETEDFIHIPVLGATVSGSPVEVHLNRHFLSKALRFGLPRATALASNIMKQWLKEADGRERHVIHLGDIYYSGWEDEANDRFLKYWPVETSDADKIKSWALNGNHEMFCGGHGYFNVVLKDPRVARQQDSNRFTLRHPKWEILGADTAYQDDSLIHDQAAWVRQSLADAKSQFERKGMLLTHHQLFSAYESNSKNLGRELKEAFDEELIRCWFWGHEHRFVVYEPHMGIEFARCIGHGGVPVYQWRDDADTVKEPAKFEFRRSFTTTGGLERWALFGFAVLDFKPNGEIHTYYVDERGETNFGAQQDETGRRFEIIS